jgi:L-amino acid N-acyltransferase YncA
VDSNTATVRRMMETGDMALAERELGDLVEPPSGAAPSVAAAVAGRWARTKGRTWAPPSPVVAPEPANGRHWLPTAADIRIARMRADHAEQVLAIYQTGLDTDNASFETSAPTWDRFDTAHLPDHRFVACDRRTGAVLGWVALTAVSNRPAYSGVAEESIYVHPGVRGVGVGSALLAAAVASSAASGIWTLQAGIFPENLASVALHRGLGFRIVGVRERIAQHRGRWRNMLLLERCEHCEGSRRGPAEQPSSEVGHDASD